MDNSTSRPRRVNQKKSGKFELLKKIREAKEKGERFVVEKEEKPVYETVDEGTYSKIVQQRIEDDWIVDDDGLGYTDDGREIFDDHDGDLDESALNQRSKLTSSKKRRNPDLRPSTASSSHVSGVRDIRNMFASPAVRQPKRSSQAVDSTAQDSALDDLLAELSTEKLKARLPKMPRQDPQRKSLSSLPKPPAPSLSRPRRETCHAIQPKKPISRNPYATGAQQNPDEVKNITNDSHPTLSAVKVETKPDPEPMEEELDPTMFQDGNFYEEEKETLGSESIKLEDPKSAVWLIEEEEEDTSTRMTDHKNPLTFSLGGSDHDRLQFFWLDAYEDIKSQPGTVFLFGKVSCKEDVTGFKSCCVRIKDLDRRVFFLPRPETEYTVKDVYGELRDLSGQWKIGKFKCKPTTKKYSFDHIDVPSEAEYLEVRYAAIFPALPNDLSGITFSRIFGASTPFLENLIVDLHLRGPCWLEITGATPLQPQLSWCRADYDFSWQPSATSNNKIVKLADAHLSQNSSTVPFSPLPPPPLRVVAIDIKSVMRKQTNSSEIVSVGLLLDNHFHLDKPAGNKAFQSHYLVLAPPRDAVLPYDLSKRLPTWGAQYQPPSSANGSISGVDLEPNERALLGRLLARIHQLDPDLIIGHDLWGNQLDLLVHRMNAHKVPHWHRIGRLRRSAHFAINFNRSWFIRNALPGRLICDTRISSRELVRSRTYNLSELAHQILGGGGGGDASKSSRRQIPSAVARQFSISLPPPNDTAIDDAVFSGVDLEVDSADLRCLFGSSALVKELIDFCLSDALLVLRLAHQLQVLPLANQITTICGNVLSRTLAGGRSERNDALLLHAFSEQGYLVPDAVFGNFPGAKHARGTAKEPEYTMTTEGGDQDGGDEQRAAGGKRKPAYAGGLVLEPKRGFYDTFILLLDFNSLYPSIIQEFNLCFTTMERSFLASKNSGESTTDDNEDMYISALIASVTQTVGGADDLGHQRGRLPTSRPPGILPMEVRRLVESRKEVKKLIASASSADAAKVAQWNIRQQALKITANSVYGCLGFTASRFCARGLAALVTGLGRALLVNTKELVENMTLEVIYGDTDSIMVNTNTTDLLSALAIGEKVKHEVNKRYRLVELDTDGVFASMLLLAKKKYAALSIVRPLQYAEVLRAKNPVGSQPQPPPPTKPEMKGLDIVRRDWCRLAAEVGRFCVQTLLSGRANSESVLETIHEHLRAIAQQVRDGALPKTDFVITKMLTKNPEDYPDVKTQPHVQVALRLNQQTGAGHRFRAGDTVEYIICDDGTNRSAVQRAYSPNELVVGVNVINAQAEVGKDGVSKIEHNLTIDVRYYLANQIHPVVSRLVAPIEGTSPAHIADCLGLDSTSYRHTTGATASGADYDGGLLGNGEIGSSIFSGNFLNDASPLRITCSSCRNESEGARKQCSGTAVIRDSPFTQAGLAKWTCSDCSECILRSPKDAYAVVNAICLQARDHIAKYECGWMVCEDPTCGLITRALACPGSGAGDSSLWTSGLQPLCPVCGTGQSILRPRLSETQLYRQLLFYRHLLIDETAIENKKNRRGEAMASSYDVPSNLQPAIRTILEVGLKQIQRHLSQSAFAMVDLDQIFAGLRGSAKTSLLNTANAVRKSTQAL